MSKSIHLIAACSDNRVIGRDGRLPWRIAEDWEFFRRQTTGALVILGRVSFASWRSFFDEDREAIVITRDHTLAGPRVRVAASLTEALALAAASNREVYVCGGERLFAEAIKLPQVSRLHLTLVHADVAGDRFFPDWRTEFPVVRSAREGADANFRYTFLTLARR